MGRLWPVSTHLLLLRHHHPARHRAGVSLILSHPDCFTHDLEMTQGLIIDSFGELRDHVESVKTDDETKCFICGIGMLALSDKFSGLE